MNTREVISALYHSEAGTKFSHPYFSSDEYVTKGEDGHLYTEEGYSVIDEFWEIRKDWTGWYQVDKHVESQTDNAVQNYEIQNYDRMPMDYCFRGEVASSPKQYGQYLQGKRNHKKFKRH